MSEPYASAPPGHPRSVKSTPGVQSGIAAKSDKLWGFENVERAISTGKEIIHPNGSVPLQYLFIDGDPELQDFVRDTIHKDRRPPDFETWEDYANVRFIETPEAAHIRITFVAKPNDDWYWCKLGTEAIDVPPGDPTMQLAGLRKRSGLSEQSLKEHRGYIMHEFGHALGLHHEHQGPAAWDELKLIRSKVVKDKRFCESHMSAYVDQQIMRKIQPEELMNYTKFDKHSIMIYDIPKNWQGSRNRAAIAPTHTLSELDKAFIQLIYPPDLGKGEKIRERFRKAVVTAGVPPDDAGRIFGAYMGDNRTLAERFTSVRDCFNRLKAGAWFLWNSQRSPGITHMIDPASSTQFGVNGFIGDVAENRLFQSIMKNIVHRTMEQHGISTRVPLPGSTQSQVTRMLAALAMDNDFGRHIDQHVSQLGDLSIPPSTLGPQDNDSTAEDRSLRASS